MKYSTQKYFEVEDFKDGVKVEKLTGHDFQKECEIECEAECDFAPYRRATRLDPAEGGDVEDVVIVYAGKCLACDGVGVKDYYGIDNKCKTCNGNGNGKKIDLTGELTESALETLEETMCEDARQNEADSADAAAEAKGDEMRERNE